MYNMENNMMELLYESNILNQNIDYYILENKYNAELGIVTEGEKFDKFKSLCQKYLSTFRESIKNLELLYQHRLKKIKDVFNKKIKNARVIDISNIDDASSSKLKNFINSHNKRISITIKDGRKKSMDETIENLYKYKYGLTDSQLDEVEKAIRNNELIFLTMDQSKEKILVGKIFDINVPTLVVKNYSTLFSKEICKYMDIFLKETDSEKRKEILKIKTSEYIKKYDLPIYSQIKYTVKYREVDTAKLAFIFSVETSFKENLKQLEKTYNSACKIFNDNKENFKEEIAKLYNLINFYNTNYSKCIETILNILNNFFDTAVPIYE